MSLQGIKTHNRSDPFKVLIRGWTTNAVLFINDTIKKFEELKANTMEKEKCEKDFLFIIGLPYFGKISHQFSKRPKVLTKNKFNVDINVYYTTLKTGSYFQLKCSTPMHLISNVVYKFTCSCDTNVTHIGMTT